MIYNRKKLKEENKMLQQVMTNPGEIIFREVPVPEVGDDQVLVKIMNIGICGSDIHVYHGKHPFTKYPVTQGHEVSGEITGLEQNGFVISLDYYVYEKAFQWLQKFSGQLPADFRISLNVSPQHFEEPEIFVKKIRELILTYQVDTFRLTFEITESTYVNNTEAVNRVIRGLKKHNIQISMDDFGSGYSSLNALKDLLFNEVKIDRKFLGDSLTENAKIVLQEVFHMLKRMGKSIVCEGVETEDIAEFLKEEGCDEIQGFLYYRPMCEEDFEKLLHTPTA